MRGGRTVVLVQLALAASTFFVTRHLLAGGEPGTASRRDTPPESSPPAPSPPAPAQVSFEIDTGRADGFGVRVERRGGALKRVTATFVLFDAKGETVFEEARDPVTLAHPAPSARLGWMQLPAGLADGHYRAYVITAWREGEAVVTSDRDLFFTLQGGQATVVDARSWFLEAGRLSLQQKGD